MSVILSYWKNLVRFVMFDHIKKNRVIFSAQMPSFFVLYPDV